MPSFMKNNKEVELDDILWKQIRTLSLEHVSACLICSTAVLALVTPLSCGRKPGRNPKIRKRYGPISFQWHTNWKASSQPYNLFRGWIWPQTWEIMHWAAPVPYPIYWKRDWEKFHHKCCFGRLLCSVIGTPWLVQSLSESIWRYFEMHFSWTWMKSAADDANGNNGLLQGNILAPLLFSVYASYQPIHPKTKRFLYADDLCIALKICRLRK